MTQITAQAAGGLASATGTWIGGVVPVDGDCVLIPAGTTVTWDITTRTLGSKVAATNHGIFVRGTAGNQGQLIVNDGCTLTLRGYDRNNVTGGACVALLEPYGKFKPQPGATILLDVATDGQSAFYAHGQIESIGTSVKACTWDLPAANKNWNTAHSFANPYTIFAPYDWVRGIACGYLGATCLSNASGTGIGTMADSSVSFSSITPAGLFTTPVASISLVTSAGKYYIDHEGGHVFFYDTQAAGTGITFTVTAKKLSRVGCAIRTGDLVSDNIQSTFRYSTFIGLGTSGSEYALTAIYATFATGTLRGFEATNCTFKYGTGVMLRGVVGTAANPIKVEDNDFVGLLFSDYGGPISLFAGATDYLSIQRNKARLSRWFFVTNNFAGPHPNAVVKDNVVWAPSFFWNADGSPAWADLDLSGNAMLGTGALADTRQITMIQGTSGHDAKVQNNLSWRPMRWLNFQSFSQVLDNVLGYNNHHSIMGPFNGSDDMYSQAVQIKRNLSIHAVGGAGFAELGYNVNGFADGAVVEHNTVVDNDSPAGAYDFGDQYDNTGAQLITGLSHRSNLAVSCARAFNRKADIAGSMERLHFAAQDYNGAYNSTLGDFGGTFPRFCTPSGLVNVTGVSLHSPSFSAAVSGKTLALVVTSGSNKTLAWDGGTAQQIIQDTGAATSSESSVAWPSQSFLNDSGKTWSTDMSAAGCPAGRWCLITSGVNSGLVRRVSSNSSGTRLKLVPALPAPIGVGDTYVLMKSEVTLPNSGATATIVAGIDARLLPTTSKSDTGVAIAFNGQTLDPQFVDSTRNVGTWDASLGGPGTEESAYARLYADPTLTRTALLPYLKAGFAPRNVAISTAAHDGTTIGAIPYVAPPFAADHLTVTTQPSSPIASGAAHATQPVVAVKDAVGNTVTTDTSTVTATLVVETGSATPLGTLTKAAVAGVANFSANGLGATSVGGATAHWQFTDGVLPAVNSATFTIVAGGASADQFLVVAGLIIPVLEGTPVEQLEQGGSSQRAQAGNLLSDCPWEKLTWQATTGLMTRTEVAALKAAIAFRAHVAVSGLMPGVPVTCEVTWSNGAYINTSTADGTGILRSLVLLLRQV
jgi:hypothetical protein